SRALAMQGVAMPLRLTITMETLADALTSLEYYLEGGAVLRPQGQPDVLDLASASVKALGLPVAA
ncbi:hypothetical protein ACLBVR_34770, partial [Pseudomonas aeruginosa]